MIDRSKAPAIHPFTDVHLDFPEVKYLSNGIPIQVIDRGTDEVNRIALFVRGGILDESRRMQAMLTSATAVEGFDGMTSSDIALKLDFNGAWKSTQAYDDWTEISFWSLNECYGETLEILKGCLTSPTFKEEDLALLQRRYAGTYATQRVRGKYMASLALRRMLYGVNHPLAGDITPEDVMAITSTDIRAFYHRFYKPEGMRVVLAGRINDEIFAMTDATIGQINIVGEVPPMYDWSSFNFPSEARQEIVDMPDAVQSSISMAIPAVPRRHPDYFKLRVLVTLFGGYFGSRLMRNIREEKGYTYGISAILAGREHSGYIGISTECETIHTWSLIEEVKHEMQRLREEVVPQTELEIVKQNMLSDLVKTLDTPFNVAGYVASAITFGVYPEYFNEHVKAIIDITPVDLLQMAQRYLVEDKLFTVIAAPRSCL